MRPKPGDIANHLAHLSQTKNLTPSTLKTRRAAISSVLAAKGDKSTAADPVISGVIKGAANLHHKKRSFLPKWDLAVVLNYLKSPKFAKNSLLTFDLLTYKTVFLIALASGRRASEISNLSGLQGDLAKAPKGALSLKFLPEFLAKNQNPEDPSPNILIPPLPTSGSRDEASTALCPVRALKAYRARSKSFRSPTQRALFISVNKGNTADITRATISRWLKTTIRNSYLALNREDSQGNPPPPVPSEARAHEIRAWAATMASTSTSMTQVLKAAYWRSSTVFIRHYLRDIALRSEDGTRSLPVMVAAQTPVPART